MRWIEHWKISKMVLRRKSLCYQLGSILPDWFERRPRHTMEHSLDRVLKKIEKVQTMKNGRRRDYLLGTIMHYLEDYCCFAHNDNEYTKWYKHRVFEVQSQKYFREHYKYYLPLIDNLQDKDFCEFITKTVRKMEKYVYNLHNENWERDVRIIKCNIEFAFYLTNGVLDLIEENNYANTTTNSV